MLDPWYVTGLIEGAGTFTFSRSGKQLALYFAVKAIDSDTLLQELTEFFGAGTLYRIKGASYFRVQRHDELQRVVAHFDQFPLRSRKRASYAIWREMVEAKRQFRRPDRDRLEVLAEQLRALHAG